MNAPANPQSNAELLAEFGSRLVTAEKEMFKAIGDALAKENPGRDRAKCDAIFGTYYSHGFLRHCARHGLESRAAIIGTQLSHAVLGLEKKLKTEFHKGALFHDTALAHFISGNEDQYEYMLAMADEEDFKTCVAANQHHQRGTLNLRANALTGQTLQDRLAVACDVLNGITSGHPSNYMFATGAAAPVSPTQLDAWRQTLDPLHQFEFLRFVHDIYVFLGIEHPGYEAVKDNPFVMLRLAKALSHLSQWVESCLTDWQGRAIHGTLSDKLRGDPHFGNSLSTEAGSVAAFAGNNPANHGGAAAVDVALQQLLGDIVAAPVGPQRYWRTLRILYIVRNSTAHTIEPNLAMYNNRAFLLNLTQVVFLSLFVICKLKGLKMPN
jgi:hypothetical protein